MNDELADALLETLAVTNQKLGHIQTMLAELLEHTKDINVNTSRIGDD